MVCLVCSCLSRQGFWQPVRVWERWTRSTLCRVVYSAVKYIAQYHCSYTGGGQTISLVNASGVAWIFPPLYYRPLPWHVSRWSSRTPSRRRRGLWRTLLPQTSQECLHAILPRWAAIHTPVVRRHASRGTPSAPCPGDAPSPPSPGRNPAPSRHGIGHSHVDGVTGSRRRASHDHGE